jgi:hypothetical protein
MPAQLVTLSGDPVDLQAQHASHLVALLLPQLFVSLGLPGLPLQ